MQNGLRAWLSWQPDPEAFRAPLDSPVPWRLRMEKLRRGIDNTHVDVLLGARFQSRAALLVRRLINQDIALNYWPDAGPVAEHEDLENFRAAYQSLAEAALARTSKDLGLQGVQLLQLALLKYLLVQVGQEFEQIKSKIRQARGVENTLSSGKSLELHERLFTLTREEPVIRYRVMRRLFRFVQRFEGTVLRKSRKSVLGLSWPIPKAALFNPLLQMHPLNFPELFMNHYPMLFSGNRGAVHFDRMNRILFDVLADYLPLWTAPDTAYVGNGTTENAPVMRVDQGDLPGFAEIEERLRGALLKDEYLQSNWSWIDVPENMNLFMNSAPDSAVSKGQPQSKLPWPQRQWPEFQRRVMARLIKHIERVRLLPLILASYRTGPLVRELAGRVAAEDIYSYLCGELGLRKLLRRVDGETADIAERLKLAMQELKQCDSARRHGYVARFLYDFLVFRRDLKLAFKTYEAMDQIRFLEKTEDISLSRANGSLFEFHEASETEPGERRIRSHVILKADVRGSTAITAHLRVSELNPASYFSLNLFGPINKLLEEYGATKVFVEGDAVILAFYEQEGDDVRWLSVARACSLAQRILSVVEANTLRSRELGLPPLELGIGIAFENESPAFLYDDDRKIMISPAINRADQLSSSSPELGRGDDCGARRGERVKVALPSDSIASLGQHAKSFVRYNVNGIEIDAVAFRKLQSEMVLRQVDLPADDKSLRRFHAGRYVDRDGRSHWLILREGAVRLWDGKNLTAFDPEGRRYYEVITDSQLIDQVKERMQRTPEA